MQGLDIYLQRVEARLQALLVRVLVGCRFLVVRVAKVAQKHISKNQDSDIPYKRGDMPC